MKLVFNSFSILVAVKVNAVHSDATDNRDITCENSHSGAGSTFE